MTRLFILTLVASAAWLSLAAQQSISGLFTAANDTGLRGRIVLFDWASHETTSDDDFVVQTTAESKYARVIYKHFWGFDAPPGTSKAVLDRWAFVGRGATWSFAVHVPQSIEEKAACLSPIVNHKYEDESGSGEIPRFIATPGANTEKIPPVQSLPCFILKRDGLVRVDIVNPATGRVPRPSSGPV